MYRVVFRWEELRKTTDNTNPNVTVAYEQLPCISACKISSSQTDPLREAKRITEKMSHVIATQYYSVSLTQTDKWRYGLKHKKCCERLR